MRLEDLMERAAQYDENLARDIKDYVHGRKYGLVYEASKPEFVRMWKKPVVRGDIVNILPPRGVMEDTKNEDDPSEIVYKVIAISEGVATLRNEKTGETVTASVDDGIPHTVFLDKPVADTQESGGKKYSKHVVNDPKTHMAWFNLYDSEDAVVMHELRKPEVICWYRNPVGKTTGQSLRIPYRLGDDRKVLHPDFIFFEKVGDREMPAIVDPHGLHLADTMPKLKGIARYVEDFGESFSRYWFVSDYKGQATYLDMKDAETRSVISTASDAYECFAKCGKKYMDGPLSKSKDGYRKK